MRPLQTVVKVKLTSEKSAARFPGSHNPLRLPTEDALPETIRAFPIAVVPPRRRVEPTFYLDGQPYVFEREEVAKAGPEFAQMAFYETWRHLWRLWVQRQTHAVSNDEFEQRMIDLYYGALQLRELIPGDDTLLPNGHFRNVH